MTAFSLRRALALGSLSLASLALVVPPASAALGPQHYAAQDYSFGEWMEKLQPVLRSRKTVYDPTQPVGQRVSYQPFDWRHDTDFMFMLPAASPAADWEAIPGGGALTMAAKYYVLATGDLTPTPGKVVQAGWWPYDTLPAGVDVNLPIAQDTRSGWPIENKYTVLKNIGSPEWVDYARSQILEYFYSSFYFDKAHGLRAPGELPAQLPAFWAAPDTGEPYQQFTEQTHLTSGYRMQDANGLLMGGAAGRVPGAMGGFDARQQQQPNLPDKRLVPMISSYRVPGSSVHALAGQHVPLLLANCRTLAHEDELRVTLQRSQENPLPYAALDYAQRLPTILRPGPDTNPNYLHDIKLDDSGERAPIEQLPCPLALELAAKYYALATLDNQVSLRDLVESGFWPYDTFPASLDLSETLYNFPRNIEASIYYSPAHEANGSMPAETAHLSGSLTTMLGSREWLLWRKAEILNQVHAELYFTPTREFMPQQGVDPRQTDILPRFAAFWADPLAADDTGATPPFSFGQRAGQLSLLDVNRLRPQFEGVRLSYQQQVPLINLADKSSEPGVDCCVLLARRTDVQGIEQSYAVRLPASAGGGLGEVRWVYDEPATRQDAVLLDTGWRDQRYAAMTPEQATQQRWAQLPQDGAALIATGVRAGNVIFFGSDFSAKPRLVYNGIAPLLARAKLSPWAAGLGLDGYAFIASVGDLSGWFNQLPGEPCGIDWLAEPTAVTPAVMK